MDFNDTDRYPGVYKIDLPIGKGRIALAYMIAGSKKKHLLIDPDLSQICRMIAVFDMTPVRRSDGQRINEYLISHWVAARYPRTAETSTFDLKKLMHAA